jgi:hypothetical protein
MRLIHLPTLAIMAALSFPAFAGSDSTELPNPFTDQPSASANVTATDSGVAGFSGATPRPALQPPQGSAPPSSGGDFYQAAKKDTDGR